MYAAHFGLREPPFAITPDPAYVYLSRHHREALAHLLYGTGENGGFVQLTGEVGTGKTTLVRALLEQGLTQVDIALCLNPRLTVEELLATICDELGVAYPRESHSLKTLVDALNEHLLRAHAAGRRTVLIVDEAQNLSREVLEQVRLLTNLETAKHKLLRIILVGQPELRALLARPDLRQLAQRITARYHLPPLNPEETVAYIGHRLRVAGASDDLFTPGALRAVHRCSGGIPRLINIICDRALLGAYGQGARRVDASRIRRAAREALQSGASARASQHWLALGVGGIGLAMIGVGLWLPRPAPVSVPTVAPAAAPPTPSAPATVQPPKAAPTVAPAPAPAKTSAPATAQPSKTAPPPVSAPAPTPLPEPAVSGGGGRAAGSSPPPASAGTGGDDPAALRALMGRATPAATNSQLLAIWGVTQPLSGKNPFCEQVKAHRLRCLSGRGDWDALRRLDRPAVLRLTRPGGIAAPVVLRALGTDTATLEIAGETRTVSLEHVKPLWSGQYLLLWRPQTDQPVIGPGNSGSSVLWLRQRLAMARGQTLAEPASETFDAELAKQLRAFQEARGLRPDGIAGGQTLVLLSNLAPAPDTPSLRRPAVDP